MPNLWLDAARRRSSRATRWSTTAVLVMASVTILAAGLTASASARSSTPTGLLGAHHTAIAREAGRGTRVDARKSARDAALAPRVHKSLKKLKTDFGARPATATAAGTSSLAAVATRIGSTSEIGAPRIVAQPAPVVTTSFAGITESQVCSCEPPDPWIAVSPTYVVQSTNGMIRVSNRSGSTILSEPTWALFAVPVDRADSDPRILWDAVHGRWVGVVVTYNGDFSQNGLRLAISETADPTAGWIVYPLDFYGVDLPDYPGISSSGSRIVLTSNDFAFGAPPFLGPTWLEIDWANVLAGTDLFVGGIQYRPPNPLFGHFRPAIGLSTMVNTPVIYEDGAHPGYFEIAGTAHAPALTNPADLNASFGIADFSLPPAPVQPGAIAIATAADERPTDAVYRDGALWFVATGDYFDGVDHWGMARYTLVSTTANGLPPTSAADQLLSTPGTHYFIPGVGINADGSAIMAATKTDPTSVYATTIIGGVLAGSVVTPWVDIEASTVAYTGDRWGDYLGIAADPSGAGAVWMGHELVAADGSWRTSVVRIVSDSSAPGVPGAVSQVPLVGSRLGATIPVRTSWGAATDVDSGVAAYLVERSDDGGGMVGVQTTGTSITQPLLVGHTVQYRISALDAVGNVGLPRYGPIWRPSLYQQTSSTVYTGTWSTSSSASYSGGSTRFASIAGRYATFRATSARSIAIVSTKGPSRGSFKVYVDGVYRATVSTYATSTKYRQLVYQFTWTTPGTHKIKIYVLGTAHHPRIDIDAFVVLR